MNTAKKHAAFDGVYTELASDVFAYFNVCFGAQAAEDLTQEVFLRVWRAIEAENPPDNWRAWTFRCAVNLKNDFLRRAYATRETAEIPETQVDVSAKTEDTQRLAVQQAFARLPQAEREMLSLKNSGFTSEEIGTWLGVTASAARTRMQKAKQHFARLLEWEENIDA